MDLKAKLVELLNEAEEWADHKCDVLDCETCPADKMKGNCVQQLMVDRLISHGVTVQEWISVKDRLPEEDTGKVLCITKSGHYHILQWIETFNCWSDPYGIDFTNFRNGYVAYWMPLPQPPKGE